MNANYGDARTGRIQALRRKLSPPLETSGEKLISQVSFFVTLFVALRTFDWLIEIDASITGITIIDFVLIFGGFVAAPFLAAGIAVRIFTSARGRFRRDAAG
jgi:hypothetical protein